VGSNPAAPTKSVASRFWAKVNRGGGSEACWTWKGAKNQSGYGNFYFEGRVRKAHQVALELDGRPLPNGLETRHLCGNRACVNPRHLEAGTHAENMCDPSPEGRQRGKLTRECVLELRSRRSAGASLEELAEAFGVTWKYVSLICTGKKWPEFGPLVTTEAMAATARRLRSVKARAQAANASVANSSTTEAA
jgi:hypothetical protein